mgnify:CR=1 FL=1
MIPFVNLTSQREKYHFELKDAEQSVLDSGCFIGGPQVEALEKELSAYLDNTHVQTCASGTDALTIALMTLGLTPGDEVIVPDFTFIAPAECIAFLGATPVFADIDRDTLQISPESVHSLIGPRTRGIVAVDLFGQCAPFYELRQVADAHGLWLVEDAAQAFGATVFDTDSPRKACTFGDISITSFYPSKPLGCYGDGGALFTAREDLARKMRMIANHGSSGRYRHETIGINSRLDALQAAVLRVKLRHLDEELPVRRRNAEKYNQFFEAGNRTAIDGQEIQLQKIAPGNTSTYAQYTILAGNRDSFTGMLEHAEIPYCIHYPTPLHRQPCFSKTAQQSCPNAQWASEHALSLPVCAFTNVDLIIEKMAF